MIARSRLDFVFLLSLSATLMAQSGFQGHDLNHTLIFPVMVMGGPEALTPRLFLSNPQPGEAVSGTVYIFSQEGKPLRLYKDPIDPDTALVNGLNVSLRPGGSKFLEIYAETEGLTVGWALFDVTAPANSDLKTRAAGSLLTSYTKANGTTGLVGVVAANYEPGRHKRISIPVWLGTGVDIGVALVNAGAAPLTVVCELRDSSGAVIKSTAQTASRISPLAPGHQVALFVTEMFPDFQVGNSAFNGSLLISTDQEGLEAAGLLGYLGELTPISTVHFAAPDASWTAVNTGLGDLKIKSLAVDPANSDTVYAGTESQGVFKSTDAGASWAPTGLTDGAVNALAIDSSNPTTIYAGTETKGLLKSTDAGISWSNTGLPIQSVASLTIDPRNSANLTAAHFDLSSSFSFSPASLFTSSDWGASWTAKSIPRCEFIAVDSQNPDHLYVTHTDPMGEFSELWRSADGGTEWNQPSQCCHDVGFISRLAIDPTNPDTLYGQGLGNSAIKSTDGGNTWKRIDLVITAIIEDKQTAATLYSIAGRTLYRSLDRGVTWSPFNQGLSPGVEALVVSSSKPGTLFAGTNGNGVFKYAP